MTELKVMLASTHGSGRDGLVDRLQTWLREQGCKVEHVRLPPLGPDPLTQMVAFRSVPMPASSHALICLDRVSALLAHPCKITWVENEKAPHGDWAVAQSLAAGRQEACLDLSSTRQSPASELKGFERLLTAVKKCA